MRTQQMLVAVLATLMAATVHAQVAGASQPALPGGPRSADRFVGAVYDELSKSKQP